MPTKTQIKKIHALIGALKMDDDTYRATLGGYGVKTSTKLSITKADLLIGDLEKKAIAAGVWQKRQAATKARTTRPLADDDQSKMIRGLWIELHQLGAVRDPSEAALASYAKRMARVQALQWLTVKQAQTMIEALKQWRERVRWERFMKWLPTSGFPCPDMKGLYTLRGQIIEMSLGEQVREGFKEMWPDLAEILEAYTAKDRGAA